MRCFLAIGTQIANHLNIPAMDGGKMIDAISLLEQVEQGPRAGASAGVVGIVGGGNTAMDAARAAKRLGAEEARSDLPLRQGAHARASLRGEEAIAEGVKIKWLSSVKQFGQDDVLVERMELDAKGRPRPTGQFEKLKADSLSCSPSASDSTRRPS